jgi:hypothetical protein
MSETRTETLIGSLAAGLQPVRRMPRPQVQALLWVAGAVLVVGAAIAVSGLRHDLHARMAMPYEVAQWTLSVLVGVLSALAAAMLARPDRDRRWALLPLPFGLAWVATLGWGCLDDMDRMGPDAMVMHTSWTCMRFILQIGLPLAALQFWLLRHAGPVRPLPVLLLGSLASAAFCSAGLSLEHHLDAALMILVWHGASALLLVTICAAVGRPLLLRPPAG